MCVCVLGSRGGEGFLRAESVVSRFPEVGVDRAADGCGAEGERLPGE